MKKRITEVEESNEVATLALSRSKMAIRRLRLEYAVLLERLEQRAIMIPDGNTELEDMSPPPSPTILDESLNTTNAKLTRNGLSKEAAKKQKEYQIQLETVEVIIAVPSVLEIRIYQRDRRMHT